MVPRTPLEEREHRRWQEPRRSNPSAPVHSTSRDPSYRGSRQERVEPRSHAGAGEAERVGVLAGRAKALGLAADWMQQVRKVRRSVSQALRQSIVRPAT